MYILLNFQFKSDARWFRYSHFCRLKILVNSSYLNKQTVNDKKTSLLVATHIRTRVYMLNKMGGR
jgi:hypothetical protein